MTAAATTIASDTSAASGALSPVGWAAIRADGDLQFAPVTIPEIPAHEPNWFENLLGEVLRWLAELFAPLGQWIGASWWWLQWVLLAAIIGFALALLVRLYCPGTGFGRQRRAIASAQEWQPDHAASVALLEDADRLAAEGRFDEATRLLLHRSVGHIASARPDWVEPSSTARELAALPALPDAARTAFQVIAERVERSLFALRALEQPDWEAARAAYAEFALAHLKSASGAA